MEQIWMNGKREIRSRWKDLDDYKGLHVTRVGAMCFKDGKICLIRSGGGKKWVIPGGKPEKDESMEQALRRELDEEATLTVKNIKLLGATENFIKDNPKKNEGDHFFKLFFTADITELNPQTEDPDAGVTRERIFIRPEEFKDYIDWGPLSDAIKARIYQFLQASVADNH